MAEPEPTLQPGDIVRYKVRRAETWHQGEVRELHRDPSGLWTILIAPDSMREQRPQLSLRITWVASGQEYLVGNQPFDITTIGRRDPTPPDPDSKRLENWLRVLADLVRTEVQDPTIRALLGQCITRALDGETVKGGDDGTDD